MPILADKEQCTGCAACANKCPRQCIKMADDELGFKYPVINLDECIGCNACTNVCPVLHTESSVKNKYNDIYAAWSTDDNLRDSSSSGGIFSELAKDILKSGGVVFGAAFNEAFLVEHIFVDDINMLYKLRGSKYLQSDMSMSYREVQSCLKQGRKVLFCGTPCQVAALKQYLNCDQENLLSVDFICHGVPSPKVWKDYLLYQNKLYNKDIRQLLSINMRSKVSGWSRYNYSMAFEYSDGEKRYIHNQDNLFMKLFGGDYILRESCFECQFKGFERVSDITLGDFWGIWNIDSEMDDNKGTSLVIVHNQKGSSAIADIKERTNIKPMSKDEALRENPSIVVSANHNENRNMIIDKIKSGQFDVLEKILSSKKRTKVSIFKQMLFKLKRCYVKIKNIFK